MSKYRTDGDFIDCNVEVKKRKGESDKDLIKRFERAVRGSEILIEYRKRQRFVKPSKKRRLAKKKAKRKHEEKNNQ